MSTVSRLITFFTPEQYQLSLELNRIGRNFRGTVSITGVMHEDATSIILHAKDLTVESVLIDGKIATHKEQENDELVITQDGLQPGKHSIVLGFSGRITDAMNGLYPCYYEHAGVKKELLATQFESHHAREVFPCVDEPEAKATFDLTLTTEDDMTVLGNMPISSQDSDGRQMVTVFEKTPRMSTYLLAFVVGELHCKTARTKNNVEINVWATPAQSLESLDFALDTSVRVTEFFEDYFDAPYPLPKCDHVALPDFAAGAMENWGLITYRETALLAQPGSTSISSRQYVARVIAHEISHQWFGNLVTMKWWDTLWLNESFATLMMYLSIQATHPEWDSWLDFSASQPVLALDRDSIDGVQSVQTDVSHPDEINTLFDPAIVYAKGARLLRMLQHYIGEEAFQAGLTRYFKQHSYRNTEGNDLWRALADASGKDIIGIMNTWISQPGFPMVSASRTADGVRLTQERFFVGPHEPSQQLWPIPLDGQATELPELLTDQSLTCNTQEGRSFRLNQADAAHFITHYDDQLFAALIEDLQTGSLPVIARLQLLHETVLLARSSNMPSTRLIPLITAYETETSEHVWRALAAAIAELRKFVEDDEEADRALKSLTAKITRTLYERLGWDKISDEPETDTKLRTIIIGLVLYSEDKEALAKARALYESTPLEHLNPDLRPLILKSVAQFGDVSAVDELIIQYKETSSSEIQMDICSGVTATRRPDKITELLDLLRDPAVIRPQDVRRWYIQFIRNPKARSQTWQWIRDNWQWAIDTFGDGKNYDDFPRYSAMALTTRTQLTEFEEFFGPKRDIPALTRAISMGISEIKGRVELIESDGDGVKQALFEL